MASFRRPARTLRTVGRWLKVNGEAMYGAGPSPWGEEFGESSAKGAKNCGASRCSCRRRMARHGEAGQAVLHLLHGAARTFRDPADEERDQARLSTRRWRASQGQRRRWPTLPACATARCSIRWQPWWLWRSRVPRSSDNGSAPKSLDGFAARGQEAIGRIEVDIGDEQSRLAIRLKAQKCSIRPHDGGGGG